MDQLSPGLTPLTHARLPTGSPTPGACAKPQLGNQPFQGP